MISNNFVNTRSLTEAVLKGALEDVLKNAGLTENLDLEASIVNTWKHPALFGIVAIIQLASTVDESSDESFPLNKRIHGFINKLKKFTANDRFPYCISLMLPKDNGFIENAAILHDFSFRDVQKVARVVPAEDNSVLPDGSICPVSDSFQFPILITEKLI